MNNLPSALNSLISDVNVGAIAFGRLGYYYRYVAAIETGVYCVQHGDTLSEIGLYTGTHWPTLAEINNLQDSSLIHPGQILKIR